MNEIDLSNYVKICKLAIFSRRGLQYVNLKTLNAPRFSNNLVFWIRIKYFYKLLLVDTKERASIKITTPDEIYWMLTAAFPCIFFISISTSNRNHYYLLFWWFVDVFLCDSTNTS